MFGIKQFTFVTDGDVVSLSMGPSCKYFQLESGIMTSPNK